MKPIVRPRRTSTERRRPDWAMSLAGLTIVEEELVVVMVALWLEAFDYATERNNGRLSDIINHKRICNLSRASGRCRQGCSLGYPLPLPVRNFFIFNSLWQ